MQNAFSNISGLFVNLQDKTDQETFRKTLLFDVYDTITSPKNPYIFIGNNTNKTIKLNKGDVLCCYLEASETNVDECKAYAKVLNKNQLQVNTKADNIFIANQEVADKNGLKYNRIISKIREKRNFETIDNLHRQKYRFIFNDKTIKNKPIKTLDTGLQFLNICATLIAFPVKLIATFTVTALFISTPYKSICNTSSVTG